MLTNDDLSIIIGDDGGDLNKLCICSDGQMSGFGSVCDHRNLHWPITLFYWFITLVKYICKNIEKLKFERKKKGRQEGRE